MTPSAEAGHGRGGPVSRGPGDSADAAGPRLPGPGPHHPACNCTDDTIGGYGRGDLPLWEQALRRAAHGHDPVPGAPRADVVSWNAVREIDRLRLDRAAYGLPAVTR
jgi:hypothetical protein